MKGHYGSRLKISPADCRVAISPNADSSISRRRPALMVIEGRLDQVAFRPMIDGEPGMFGYMGRNPLMGPGVNNWDLALMKDFATPWFKGERSTLQFRWETFNTFNHTQFQGVNIGCSGITPAGAPCTGPNNIGNGEVGGSRSLVSKIAF